LVIKKNLLKVLVIFYSSKATLIFCPNQLCGQWIRELNDKISSKCKFKIISLMTKRDFDKYTYNDLLDADFVIVSFTFLGNKIFTLQWTPKISSFKNFYKQEWSTSDIQQIKKEFNQLGKELTDNPKISLTNKNPLIQLIHWNRFIIDEFHEIYKDTTYRYIYNLLPFITAENKWCVTATPFSQKLCLSGIVNFLTNYKNTDGNKIFIVEQIVDYLSTDCFRKNTKDSVKLEYTLPPIKEEIIWLKFSQTERMIYNAYLANKNNDKFSTYLRQLCCHPQLSTETKDVLLNCKTLDDIEKMMMSHYKSDVKLAQEKVDKTQYMINKINKKIKKQIKKPNIVLDNSDSSSDNDNEISLFVSNINDSITKSPLALENLKNTLRKYNMQLEQLTNDLDGKKSTYNFFNNVIEKIRNTINNNNTDNEETCGICLDTIAENDIGVTQCGHIFCFECLKMAVSKYNCCPYCKFKLNDKKIYLLSYKKSNKDLVSQEEKNKIQLINCLGTKLANLIIYIRESKKHTIVFSQWDDLLIRVGRILKENNIPNVFCKGNCFQRDKAIREFNNDDKIKVIMLSSDSTAAGTNLTKASQVIFIDPIYGDYKYRKSQEKQAIGRAHRLGQKKTIKVIRFIIVDSVEEEIYKMNLIEDNKHIE